MHGPTVAPVGYRIAAAHVDHGFDREAEAGHQPLVRLTVGKVRDGRFLMELASDAVSDKFAHHTEPAAGGLADDGIANIGDTRTRLDGVDGGVQAIKCALRHGPRGFGRFRRSRKSPKNRRASHRRRWSDPGSQYPRRAVHTGIGDPVTNDFIDAGATTLGKTLVTERSRPMPVLERVLVDPPVDFPGRDARAG